MVARARGNQIDCAGLHVASKLDVVANGKKKKHTNSQQEMRKKNSTPAKTGICNAGQVLWKPLIAFAGDCKSGDKHTQQYTGPGQEGVWYHVRLQRTVEAIQVWIVGYQCRCYSSQAALLEKIPTCGGRPFDIGLRNEEPGGGPHCGRGLPSSALDHPQHLDVCLRGVAGGLTWQESR